MRFPLSVVVAALGLSVSSAQRRNLRYPYDRTGDSAFVSASSATHGTAFADSGGQASVIDDMAAARIGALAESAALGSTATATVDGGATVGAPRTDDRYFSGTHVGASGTSTSLGGGSAQTSAEAGSGSNVDYGSPGYIPRTRYDNGSAIAGASATAQDPYGVDHASGGGYSQGNQVSSADVTAIAGNGSSNSQSTSGSSTEGPGFTASGTYGAAGDGGQGDGASGSQTYATSEQGHTGSDAGAGAQASATGASATSHAAAGTAQEGSTTISQSGTYSGSGGNIHAAGSASGAVSYGPDGLTISTSYGSAVGSRLGSSSNTGSTSHTTIYGGGPSSTATSTGSTRSYFEDDFDW